MLYDIAAKLPAKVSVAYNKFGLVYANAPSIPYVFVLIVILTCTYIYPFAVDPI